MINSDSQEKLPLDKDEKVRKSVRSKRPPQSFSLLIESSETGKPEGTRRGRKRKLKAKSAANAPDRPCDILPNGEPFKCDFCKSPYVITRSSKQALKNKRSRHTPAPRNKIDPYTGKILVLCNACSITFDRPRKPRKIVSMPSAEEKEKHLKEAKEFAKALAVKLDKPDAERLFCPVVRIKPCGCLQKYILADGNTEESEKRANCIIEILQEAKRLSSLKCYTLENKNPTSMSQDEKIGRQKWSSKCGPMIGMGNGQKKSKAFEEFVFTKRQFLKQDLKLCERAAQKVLVYSNNFLHKKLVTEQRSCRAKPVKGLARLGLLQSWEDISVQNCCVDNCVMMAVTHRTLLQEWRERSRKGQLEARRVIAEMLTPSAGARSNCYTFITLVTGSSRSTIVQVSHQMKQTGGDREPPVHGMKRYWRHSGKRRDSDTQNNTKISPRCSVKSGSEVTTTSTVSTATSSSTKPQTVTSASSSVIIPVSINQMAPLNNNLTLQRQQLYGIQKQIFEQQVQQQQQQHLLQQQLLQHTLIQQIGQTDTGSQNLTLLQHMIDQLNVQIQNTQQQLQQSLQNMNLIGALNNQSQIGSCPVTLQTYNQSQPGTLTTQIANTPLQQNVSVNSAQHLQLGPPLNQSQQGVNSQPIMQNNGVSVGIYPNIQVLNHVSNCITTGNIQNIPDVQIPNQNTQIVNQQPNYAADGRIYHNNDTLLNVYQDNVDGAMSNAMAQKDVHQVTNTHVPLLLQELRPLICAPQPCDGQEQSQSSDRHTYTVSPFAVQTHTDTQTGLVIYDTNGQQVSHTVQSIPGSVEQPALRQDVYTLVNPQQLEQTFITSSETQNPNSRNEYQLHPVSRVTEVNNVPIQSINKENSRIAENDIALKYAANELVSESITVSQESKVQQLEMQPVFAIPVSCSRQTGYIVREGVQKNTSANQQISVSNQQISGSDTVLINSEINCAGKKSIQSSENKNLNKKDHTDNNSNKNLATISTENVLKEYSKAVESKRNGHNLKKSVAQSTTTRAYTRLEPSQGSAFYTPNAFTKGTSMQPVLITATREMRAIDTPSAVPTTGVEPKDIPAEHGKSLQRRTNMIPAGGIADCENHLRLPKGLLRPSTASRTPVRLLADISSAGGNTVLTQSCSTTTTPRIAPKTVDTRVVRSTTSGQQQLPKDQNTSIFVVTEPRMQKKNQDFASAGSVILLPVTGIPSVSSEANTVSMSDISKRPIACSISLSTTSKTSAVPQATTSATYPAKHILIDENSSENFHTPFLTTNLPGSNLQQTFTEKEIMQIPGGSTAYTFQLPLGFTSHTIQLPGGQTAGPCIESPQAIIPSVNSELRTDIIQQPFQQASSFVTSNCSTSQSTQMQLEKLEQTIPLVGRTLSNQSNSATSPSVVPNPVSLKTSNKKFLQKSKLPVLDVSARNALQTFYRTSGSSQRLQCQSSTGTQTFQLPNGIIPQTFQIPNSALQVPSGAALVQLGTQNSKTTSNIPLVMTFGKVYLDQPKAGDLQEVTVSSSDTSNKSK